CGPRVRGAADVLDVWRPASLDLGAASSAGQALPEELFLLKSCWGRATPVARHESRHWSGAPPALEQLHLPGVAFGVDQGGAGGFGDGEAQRVEAVADAVE